MDAATRQSRGPFATARQRVKSFELETLEPRILLSGTDAAAVLPTVDPMTVAVEETQSTPQPASASISYDPAAQVDDIFGGVAETESEAPGSASEEEGGVQNDQESDILSDPSPGPNAGQDQSTSVNSSQTASPDSPTITEQLTETLRAANGPPGVAGAPASMVPTFTRGPNDLTTFNIGGYLPGTEFDQIQVTGLATLDGTLKIQLQNGFVPLLGDTFVIMTWGSRSGEFANYLGTAAIPGGGGLAFKPVYNANNLTLEVIQTPLVIPGAQTAIDTGLNTLSQIGNFLDTVGSYASSIPLIGDSLGNLVDSGTAISNAIRAQIMSIWGSLPKEADVTKAIEAWNNTTVAGFTISVKGVLGHYGAIGSDPFWWDVNLDLTPAAVNRTLQNVLGGVLGAAFSSPPQVQVTGKLNLDIGFGYDGVFFVKVDQIKAEAGVNVSGLSGFPFNLSPPGGPISINVTNGSVNLTASITATPDASILTNNIVTGPRIEQSTLGTVASSATNVANAFNLAKASSLNASFTLASNLTGFGVTFNGTPTTVDIESSDLFSGEDPDLTITVNGSLKVLNQKLTGVFTLKKTATETIIEASSVELDLNLGTGGTQVLHAENGTGKFIVLGNELAGTASLMIISGPNIPGISISGTTLNLAFNTSTSAVPTIDGAVVNLPEGPYYRVSGHAIIELTTPQASLDGDFVFEPRDTDANPANGNEEVVVGVANLSFTFSTGAMVALLNVTNASGAFVVFDTGITGKLTATASLAVPGLSVTGTFTVLLNDTTSPFTARTVDVNGTSVEIPALAAGPYLQVTASGPTAGQHAQLTVLGITMTGDFLFENRTTDNAQKVVTVAAFSVSFNLGSITHNILNISDGSGAFIITDEGFAGIGDVDVAIGVASLGLSGSFHIRVNTTDDDVDETVDIGGSSEHIDVPEGPYLQINGTGVTLTVFGIDMTGDYSFEQRTTDGGTQLITVQASNVDFDFGTSILSATNGQALFLITDSGMAGSGQITVGVQAFGMGFSHTFTWSFNNMTTPVNEMVTTGPAPPMAPSLDPEAAASPAATSSIPQLLNLLGGPYNRLSTGGPVGFSINVAGQNQSIMAALVLTLVHPNSGPDYVTVGVSSFSMTLGAGVTLAVTGGSGAFVIYPSAPTKLAGEVRIPLASATIGGTSGLSVSGTNLKVRLNNTMNDVGPVTVSISDNPADDVTIQFTGLYYRNYLAISGAADVTLTSFVTLGGNFAFEVSDADANQLKVGVSELHFDLKAGSLTIVSFNHGTGAFVIGSGGIAGVATLQFQSGLIGVSGTISLEVNTRNSAVNTTIQTPTGPKTINLTQTNYLKVCVTGYLHLGSAALPYDFYVYYNSGTGTVEFHQKVPDVLLVSISSTGAITTGLSFSDFARPDAFEFISMLRQLGEWLEAFRGASIFDLEIPFTGGKTLGDAFDWTQLFVDKIYSKMTSVEIQSAAIRAVDPLTNIPNTVSGNLAGATFKLQLGDDAPVTVTVPGAGAYATFNALVTLLDSALPASINSRVVVRKNKDDQLVIALEEAEIAKGTSLKLVAADSQINGIGFGPVDSNVNTVEQTGVMVARYGTEDFFVQLGAIFGIPVSYNAAQQVYTYNINVLPTALAEFKVPFSFTQDLGPLGSVSLNGQLKIEANVDFHFTLGIDLGAREVPRLLSSSLVPVPANGHISDAADFLLYINNDVSPIHLILPKINTNDNNSINDLATDLNNLFAGESYGGFGSPIALDQLIIAQKAGTGLAISAKSSQLGIINRLAVVSLKDNVFASEMGFGIQLSPDGSMFLTASNSTVKGLFIDNASLGASLKVTTDLAYNPNGISGSLKFGFVEINVGSGRFGTLNYNGTANPVGVSISLQNHTTGATKLYIADLMNGTSSNNIGNMVNGPNFTGSFLAELDNITVGGLGFSFPLGSPAKVSVWIPDITNFNYNANPYDAVSNNKGLFLTYPNLASLQNFTSLNFTQIIKALKTIADNLSKLSAFSFLDERLPLIDLSINDMINYAAKFADLIDEAAKGGSQSLQQTLTELKTQIDQLLNLNPNVLTISLDDNGMPPTSLVTSGGSNGGPNSSATINANGENNGLVIRTTTNTNAGDLNGSVIRIVGVSDLPGGASATTAKASWDPTAKVLTIKINPGKTTANAIMAAIALIPGTPWTATLVSSDNSLSGNTGNGTLTTVALKFLLNFTTAYSNSLPFMLDLKKLVAQLGGTNPGIAAFLEAATTLVQVEASGNLTVSASAALTLDFGLDLTNPSSIRPFFYDTTGVVLTARVLGQNIDIQASLGSVAGIFIKGATLTLDGDGNPNTGLNPAVPGGPVDPGAQFRLGLRNNNGDGRHYFDENWFSFENIDLHLKGGVSAVLPIFAPFEGTPLDSLDDNNGDGYPDNQLVIDIPDLVRLLLDTRADGGVADVRVPGGNNDLRITRTITDTNNYAVVFQQNGSVGSGANANFANNTLTVQINSDSTTATAVKTAIQSLGNFTVAFINNDPSGINTGTGKVTVSKLTLITPDFGALFDNLDICEVIASSTGPLLDGLDALLGSIQNGLNDIVANVNLPLIGNGLAGAANFIQNFREGLLKDLRDEVANAGGNGLIALENAIKKAFWNSIGPGGLNLLVDFETGEALDVAEGYSQLDVKLDCVTGLTVNLRLASEIALLDTSGNPIKLDIGVPGFGLKVDGNVILALGFDLKFGFGVNKEDGFFFNSSAPEDDPELLIYFRVTIPSLHFGGQLLFLQLDIMDNADSPSKFEGHFAVDLRDPNDDGKLTFAEMTSGGTALGDIIHAELGADAIVNLDLAASFGGNTAFPRVLGQFHLLWHFDIENGAEDPQISFDNIALDLGTFISDFLGPILDKIQDVTGPIQPIIDVVQARIPVLSDLAGETITLLDLAQAFGLLEPSTVEFIQDVASVITLINSIQGLGEGSILIPFGGFNLSSDSNGEMKNISLLNNLSNIDLGAAISNPANHGPGTSSTFVSSSSGFAGDVGSLHNFSIPVFDNPSELFNLFIGKPVRLVEWRMPTFKFMFTYVQKIPIYPPLYAQFGGSIGAEINIGFGYDTFGIQKFIDDPKKNPIHLLDGFYIITQDQSGNDIPALKLTGEIFAGASIDLGIVEVGVRGGISATIEFFWNDRSDDDGKMRVSEIIANAKQDPRCIFNIHGEISLFLEAFLKVDLFFFSIDKTWRFATITLITFDLTCPEPVLGEMIGSTLTLNIGSRAARRLEIDTTDSAETFIVRHVDGTAGSEKVDVVFGDHKQTFEGVALIVVQDAGAGGDTLDFRKVLSPVEVHGGIGNDTIYLSDGMGSIGDGGDGDDVIVASSAMTASGTYLYGGSGNDKFTSGSTSIHIYGDSRLDFSNPMPITGGTGNDTLPGTKEGDFLYGEAGDDMITGGEGDDYIEGGNGNDTIDAGAGCDFVLAGAGDDVIRGNRDDDIIDGGGGSDILLGGAGNDLLIGGDGNDKIYGHGGTDLLIGDRVGSVANLPIDVGSLAGIKTALGNMATVPGAAGIIVKGITGSGNDYIVGSGGSDIIFGGDGNDYLYGGNLAAPGDTETVEEDGNDFIDGGTGNDTIFGDDSMGRTGDRDTGIAIRSSIWYDLNLNGTRDSDEVGFGNVTVSLYTASSPPGIGTPIAIEKTDVDGAFAFVGLDPNNYIIVFNLPAGLSFTTRTTTNVTAASDDSDADPAAGPTQGQTSIFNVTYDQTLTSVSAGYTGPAKVSITDSSVAEGTTGQQTQLVFDVTLSGPQKAPVQIEYNITPGTAKATDGDYVPFTQNGLLIINPGETIAQIIILINGDTTYEAHEQFQLQIVRVQRMDSGGPVNLTLSQPTIFGTIINDDPIPSISIQDFIPGEGDYEGMPVKFVVTLSNPSQFDIMVDWRTDTSITFQGLPGDKAATPLLPNPDFTNMSGTLVFKAGVTNQVISVPTIPDARDEFDEQFWVDLFNPTRATIADDRGIGVIRDNDAPVSVSIVPLFPVGGMFRTEVTETNNSQVPVFLLVQLSGPSEKPIVVTYATSPGTAVEGVWSKSGQVSDYVGTPNESTPDNLKQLVFNPDEPLVQLITVMVNADNLVEGDEMFFVNILSADNGDIAANPLLESNHVTVVIVDDDTTPNVDTGPWNVRFSDTNYYVQEPLIGPDEAKITLIRTPGSSQAVVVFFTLGGTATPGSDYDPVFRKIIRFADDELTMTIPITIFADAVPTVEGDETIQLYLRNPTGGPVRGQPDTATLTIRDGNTPAVYVAAPVFSLIPTVTFGIWEGSSGANIAHNFYAMLKDPVTNASLVAGPGGVTVHYTTVNLTAQAGQDYVGISGNVFIPAGSSFAPIPIQITEDLISELNETFVLRLSNPVGATLAPIDATVVATIFDDDLTPITGRIFYDTNENGFKDLNESGIKSVTVDITYKSGVSTVTNTVVTNSSGFYTTNVLLGAVSVQVHADTVTSPYNGNVVSGSGSYETTTDNEAQGIDYLGIVGLPAFDDVGYHINSTFSVDPESNKDVGRGGTDDTIFGGPGNDIIDAGAGDDHVVGGHWMTATDSNVPINMGSYDAVVIAQTDPPPGIDPPLHPIYDDGPIFAVDTSGLNLNGKISGEIWLDGNGNGRQDLGELFTGGYVVVTLFDCNGNPVNATFTNTGKYTFDKIYLQMAGSNYVVQFELPGGYTFIAPVAAPPAVNSDVVVGGRTGIVTVSTGTPTISDLDAGIQTGPPAAVALIQFSEPSYSVSEAGGFLTFEVIRGNSYDGRPIVVRTEDGTAHAGVNYQAISVLVYFAVGETIKIVKVPIINTHTLGICVDPLTFNLVLRDATGKPLDTALVYLGGETYGNKTDNDTIQLGDDWDIGLGDSGNIPPPTVIDPNPPYNNLSGIVSYGGPGKDTIRGGNGPDFINGQLDNDILYGNAGVDTVLGEMGKDVIYAELDNDTIDGGFHFDTVISSRDVPNIVLNTTVPGTPATGNSLVGSEADLIHQTGGPLPQPLSTFKLFDIEMAQLFGGAQNNTFHITNWGGSAFIVGNGGDDTLLVTKDSDMKLKDATVAEGQMFQAAYGFIKDAALSLPNGATYHLSSLENVALTGGAGDNTLDAGGYSRPVTFIGLAGNDALIGGSANDTFVFTADSPLGTDTVTGNGGKDTLDFSATMAAVTANLATLAPASQVVNANLSLKLGDMIENVTGGLNDDSLTGNDLDNVLLGGPGNDYLAGGKGSETYVFDTESPWGSETIFEDILDAGFDTIDFSGTTTLSINLNMSILGTAQVVNANLTLTILGQGVEEVIGGKLDDVIRGNANKNTLRGGLGNDLLDGKSNDDVLDGGRGNDVLIGGLGIDTINEQGDTNFTLTNSSLTRGTGETDSLDSIEVANLKGGANSNVFTLTGWTGMGSIDGGDNLASPRIDTIIVGADANFTLTNLSLTISTNLGPISLAVYVVLLPFPHVVFTIDNVVLSDGPGNHTLNASLFSGTTSLSGGDGDDILIGGSGRDVLFGGLGNDKLTGGPNNDQINGGADNDQLIEARDAELFVITNTSLLTDLTGSAGDEEYDTLANIETASISGGAGSNGFDVSGFTAGIVAIDGLGGFDFVRAQAATPGVITLSDTSITFPGGAGTISLNSIEGAILTGTSGDDEIDPTLFTGIAILHGGDGNDVLKAGPGPELLDGGDGDDQFIFRQFGALHTIFVTGGDGVDTLNFSSFVVSVSVDLSNVGPPQSVAAGELDLVLQSLDVENVIGGSAPDTLIGNALDNTFTGGGGIDTIIGAGGSNTIMESADANFVLTNVSLNINGVVDMIFNIDKATLTGGTNNNTLDASAFTGSVVLDGGGGSDTLIGGSGNDILIGGAGDDILQGKAGNDTYKFDVDFALGEDTVDELPGAANGFDTLDFSETNGKTITVDLSLAVQQTVNAANLKLKLTSGSSLEAVTGGDQNDTLRGNSLDNLFTGGRGDDTISDTAGGTDTIRETRDANFTLIDTKLSIDDGMTIEVDNLTGIEQALLTGGAGDNTIDASAFTLGRVFLQGMEGNDTLYGSYGDDFLFGGDNNDILYGGAGADFLFGEDGNDSLTGAGVFNLSLGADGNDQLYGGDGNDGYFFDLSSTSTTNGIPLALDTIFENPFEGFADTIFGIGPSGIAVDLFSGAMQPYNDLNGNLILTLVLNNPGQVEFSF